MELIRTAVFLLSGLAVAFVLVPVFPSSVRAEEMSFRLVTLENGQCGVRCSQAIAASGEIVEETPDALLKFVQEHGGDSQRYGTLLLDSLGGKVFAAMQVGHVLRRLGMVVIVAGEAPNMEHFAELYPARCYSACVYALMGGRKRIVPPESSVGIHRMISYTTSSNLSDGALVRERFYDDGGMRAKLSQYSRMMGIRSDLVDLAERTSPDEIYVLTRDEITRWRLGSDR